jgi:hypothetical protein
MPERALLDDSIARALISDVLSTGHAIGSLAFAARGDI